MSKIGVKFQEFLARETARAARHKADFKAIAQLEKKTVARVEVNLCKDDPR